MPFFLALNIPVGCHCVRYWSAPNGDVPRACLF